MKLTDFNNELYVKVLEARCARLEKYCDELEKNKDKQFNAGFNEATKICSEKIIALEEALDKACEELDMLTQEFVPASNYPHITKEDELDRIDQWKEWCMKDE